MSTKRASGAKRSKISRDEIVQCALDISDSAEGLEAVTVRSIATKLGVGTMTLYGYFRSKDEILDAMADHVMGSMRLPEPDGDESPADALRAVAKGFLDLMSEHPSVTWLLSSRVTRSHASLSGAMEAVLRRLVDSGVPSETAVRCYGFLIQYAMGFAAYQAPRPWGTAGGEDGAELRRQQQHFYSGLPVGEFPLVVEHASDLVILPTDEQFGWAVERFVAMIGDALPTP